MKNQEPSMKHTSAPSSLCRMFGCIVLAISSMILSAVPDTLPFNGDFKRRLDGIPLGWGCSPAPMVKHIMSGGPDNLPYLSINATAGENSRASFNQENITLVPFEPYRFSARIRTKDFSAKDLGLLVTNAGWYDSVGFRKFPANADWQTIEMRFQCLNSKDVKRYMMIFFISGQKGTLDIADIRLEPLSERAKNSSRIPELPDNLTMPRLLPWSPALNAVPLQNPQVNFRWFGLPEKKEDIAGCKAVLRIPARNYASAPVELKSETPFTLSLAGVPEGWHDTDVQILDASGAVVFTESFRMRLVDMPSAEELARGRRLNNLCWEFMNGPAAAKAENRFGLDLDGWIYVAVSQPKDKNWQVSLDGRVIMDQKSRDHEGFRPVTAGRHAITVSTDCQLVIRRITETFACPVFTDSKVPAFQPYDWKNMLRKWVYPVLTTYSTYGMPQDKGISRYVQESGRHIFPEIAATRLTTAEELSTRVTNRFETLVQADGFAADELFYEQPVMDVYTQGLKKSAYDRSRLLYTWVNGGPSIPARHSDFIATCLNASYGRGKILHEAYHCSCATEEEAKAFVKGKVSLGSSVAFYPDYVRRAGIVLGNFNQLGICSLEHHPQMDYKYYLDMQLNAIATIPELKDLGLVGFWGCRYADEELFRWSFALLRHYVIEGRTDMLSAKYGFSYLPGHIVNNDFTKGLEGWTAVPADTDSIKPGNFTKYGDTFQARYTCRAGIGDSFCQFIGVEGKANTLSQTAKNLVPGKQYILLFSVNCLDDIKGKLFNPRRYALEAELTGATRLPGSFVWVDERKDGYGGRNSIARQNLHRIIFTADKPEVTLTFSDKGAKPGETLILNFVQVKPFFQDSVN